MPDLCPCGSDRSFADCCAPFLSGDARPPTAEALMRSRYVAFVRRDVPYLMATHAPSTRDHDVEALRRWADAVTWTGLNIERTARGRRRDTRGRVQFVASYLEGDEVGVIHEDSRFEKLGGRWFYVDGRPPTAEHPSTTPERPSRSAPCPCGSGKKFKRCCG